MQPHGIGVEPAGANLEERPAIGRHNLVRHSLSHRPQLALHLFLGQAGQIVHFKLVRFDLFEHLLLASRQHDRAQHVVPVDQTLPRAIQSFEVQPGEIRFRVVVRRDVAHLERRAAADPVGFLHVGHGKRLIAPLAIGNDVREAKL